MNATKSAVQLASHDPFAVPPVIGKSEQPPLLPTKANAGQTKGTKSRGLWFWTMVAIVGVMCVLVLWKPLSSISPLNKSSTASATYSALLTLEQALSEAGVTKPTSAGAEVVIRRCSQIDLSNVDPLAAKTIRQQISYCDKVRQLFLKIESETQDSQKTSEGIKKLAHQVAQDPGESEEGEVFWGFLADIGHASYVENLSKKYQKPIEQLKVEQEVLVKSRAEVIRSMETKYGLRRQ